MCASGRRLRLVGIGSVEIPNLLGQGERRMIRALFFGIEGSGVKVALSHGEVGAYG